MKERPIIYSTEMVKAILDGRKSQTRRVIKDPPRVEHPDQWAWISGCPYGQVGDRLWARETWAELGWHEGIAEIHYINEHMIVYLADSPVFEWCGDDGGIEYTKDGHERSQWRPSIHMPRWASRITLEITGVRVERLQEISGNDCVAEGFVVYPDIPAGDAERQEFGAYWDSLNAKKGYGWESNCWVWVIQFKVVK